MGPASGKSPKQRGEDEDADAVVVPLVSSPRTRLATRTHKVHYYQQVVEAVAGVLLRWFGGSADLHRRL